MTKETGTVKYFAPCYAVEYAGKLVGGYVRSYELAIATENDVFDYRTANNLEYSFCLHDHTFQLVMVETISNTPQQAKDKYVRYVQEQLKVQRSELATVTGKLTEVEAVDATHITYLKVQEARKEVAHRKMMLEDAEAALLREQFNYSNPEAYKQQLIETAKLNVSQHKRVVDSYEADLALMETTDPIPTPPEILTESARVIACLLDLMRTQEVSKRNET